MIYSFSSISLYGQCPALYKAKYIDKCIVEETTPAMEYGRMIHEKLEQALNNRVPNPPDGCKVPQRLWELLVEHNAQTEVKLAIDSEGNPTGFFDKAAVLRGAADVLVGRVMVDWKTGNPRFVDPFQAEVYAALLGYREWELNFLFAYTKTGDLKLFKLDHKQCYAKVVNKIAEIEAVNAFDPKPSWKCRFCPLVDCPHNKKT
jgi:CRISPR/Cas system-associated exonuclease Cas4 (RecB family)